jgi:putative ABC transport system permease protein
MSWSRRLLNLFRSNRHSSDLDRELAFHLAERIDDLEAAGLSHEAAVIEARRRFGNYGRTKEHTRDADVVSWLDALAGDLRFALRALRHTPGFALVAILSLALGIGANTAIFTLIDAVMLRSLPVSHPEELVQVTMGERGPVFTNPIWEQLRDHQTAFAGILAYSAFNRFNLAPSGEVRAVAGSLVSGNYFAVLGVQPTLGRLLSKSDDVRGCPPLAVISDAFWRSEFGADPGALGKTITLNSHAFRIVGVAQSGFTGLEVGQATSVFVPICADAVLSGPNNALDRRTSWWLTVVGRTAPGASLERIRAGLIALAPEIFEATTPPQAGAEERQRYRKVTFDLKPAANGISLMRQQYRPALLALMAIVGLVLLIACANVANLLLARAAVRRREIAIRVALGASRGRIVRQLLTESVVLSVVAALLGLVLAQWGSRLLVSFLSPSNEPIFLNLAFDMRVLGFNIAVAMLTGIGFGLAPAWRSARVQPNAALKANARGVVEGQRGLSLGKALVVVQIAVSLTLIIGAGLLLGSFKKLATLDPGFRPSDVLLVSMSHPPRPGSNVDMRSISEEVLRRVRALPEVAAASVSQITPLSNTSWNEDMVVDGFSAKSEMDGVAYFNAVSDDYFRTLGTPLLAGRDFNQGDRLGGAKVAIVNETMARHFYKTTDPVGRTFRVRVGDRMEGPFQIVGLVKDAKYQTLREETLATAFIPLGQDTTIGGGLNLDLNLELRTSGTGAIDLPSLKKVLLEVDPALSLRFTRFATQVDDSLRRERLLATLSGFFGALALLLATMGLYGVLSYNVARRRNEIGIRVALGAGRRQVTTMVLAEVSVMVCMGLVMGLGLALGVTRFIASFLFGLAPTDAATIGGSMALLAGVALFAAYLPARRASRVDPMAALRED